MLISHIVSGPKPRIRLFHPLSFRSLATHANPASHMIRQAPPISPVAPPTSTLPKTDNAHDRLILDRFRELNSRSSGASTLEVLLRQYESRAGRVLDFTLPNGSIHPLSDGASRVMRNGVVTVAHIIPGDKVLSATGFFIQPDGMQGPCIVTCAHTLEQARYACRNTSLGGTGSIVMTEEGEAWAVSEILSCLPRSDIILLSISPSSPPQLPNSLVVSMYPAQVGTRIAARFFHDDGGQEQWREGTIDGYRDLAGREAEPGTYDSLSHLVFSPPPTPGTSGGPIIDCDTGNVVGVVTGSRMYNRVEGLKGWGTPAEAIFEMFSLPVPVRLNR